MRHVLAAVAVVIAAALATGLAAVPARADVNDPYLHDVAVDAVVNADTSMHVVEHITYKFTDPKHGGTRAIPSGAYTINDISVTENGAPVNLVDNNPSSLRWGDPNQTITGVHTYDLAYTVVPAVHVAPDAGVLNWRFIGDDFPKLDRVDITVTTPGDGTDLRVFVHGALNGVSSLDGNVVHIGVDDNPAGTLVEARITEPPTDFTVPPSGEPVLPTILAEEKAFAQQANDERARLRRDEDRKRRVRTAAYAGAPIVGVAAFIGFLAIWKKWGKEPEPPADIGEYFRDVPEERPAVIQAFEGWGSVPRTAFSSTLVDLAQRGFLTITEQVHERIGRDKVDYTFATTGKADDGTLTDYEQSVLKRLFRHGGSITQEELTDDATEHRSEAVSWWSSFEKKVKADLSGRRWLNDKGHIRPFCLHFVVILVLDVVGVGMIIAGAVLAGIALFVLSGILFLLTGLLRQRTPAGARKHAEVTGLRRFLTDFSRLDEAVAGDVVLYERYLVYAVALGVSAELMQGLQAKVPDLANQPTFAAWYVGSSMGGSRFDSLSSIGGFSSGFTSATAAAFSTPSSSSGGGGGFSSGSSGGGGGGGGGSW
jgi:uncharacterized membrane protein